MLEKRDRTGQTAGTDWKVRARQGLPLSRLVTPFTTFTGDQAVQNREALTTVFPERTLPTAVRLPQPFKGK